jgi:hypothetical protein
MSEPYSVIAVADGHGHSAHFRSAIGSEIAASLALELLSGAIADLSEPVSARVALVERLGPALVEQWTERVLADVQRHPYTLAERQVVGGDSQLDLIRPYGSTVIAMVGCPDVLGILQIGDGDSVVAFADGEIVRPLPEDPDLKGVRTTSLCQPEPLRSLRTRAIDLRDQPVKLAFIATDGFGSPRVDQSGWWMETATQLVELSDKHGFEYVAGKLFDWLDEPALYGGDDTTIALMYHAQAAQLPSHQL